MGFFSFLNRKNESNRNMMTALPVIEPQTSSLEDFEVKPTPTPDETSQKSRSLTVSYATGWPIDIIYGYLHKNYEDKGFDDAMLKNDLAFRDMNMNILRNKILMVFREINLNYDVMQHKVETQMATCRAAGLLTTVSDIEKTLTIINTHKEELRQLENDFRNNENEASIPLQTYECGFLRGVATIAKTVAEHPMNAGQMPSFSTMDTVMKSA